MPKKTNDLNEKELTKKTAKTEAKKDTVKATKAKSTAKSASKTTAKKTTKKETTKKTAEKKTSTKKATAKSASKTKTSTKVASKATKKTPSKTITRKTVKKEEVLTSLEYYDLPYRYNQTIVKLLAQTPNTLFIYWDVSDEDVRKLQETYGNDFFYNTKPVLIVHNETKNYSFEVEINDFANSWYLHVSDTDCKYSIEFGRKFINNNYSNNSNENNFIQDNYVYITSSNELITPNDHILLSDFKFNENTVIKFKNIKNNTYFSKTIKDIPFVKNINVYKDEYLSEILDRTNEFTKFTNPSSNFRKNN